MNIRDAMARIVSIQKDLSVTMTDLVGRTLDTPMTIEVKRAYRYWPRGSLGITDFPCFVNLWTAPALNFESALLRGDFFVNMKFLCYDADSDVAADIASAFYPEIVTAFATNLKLGESRPVWVKRLRGGEPTIGEFRELAIDGKSPIGLDLFLDLGISRAQAMAA